MQSVEFRGWTFEVNREATQEAFAAIETGDAVKCGCSDCLRFDAVRLEILPPPVLVLFDQLGIDPAKEVEPTNFGPDGDGRDIRDWLYHFVGRVVGEPVAAESNGQVAFTPLSADFSVGFTEEATLVPAPFQDRGGVVQVECFFYEGNAPGPS